jgi:hypothetical protein
MKIFELHKNKVIVTPEVLTIPEFKKIWEMDKSNSKDTAINIFSYIYHLNNLNSPYADYDNETKEIMLRKDFLKGFKAIPKELEECNEKYKSLYETASSRFLNKGKEALAKFEKYFESIDFNERDDKGKLVYSPNELINVLKQSAVIVSSIKELQKVAQLEDNINSRMKGDRKKGMFEDPE